MSPLAPVTVLSDPRRAMPCAKGARVDIAEAAVLSLDDEVRRLSELGLEWPLARAAHQLRYWRFVRALCAIAERVGSGRAA
jgi:hypothetical protein